jgi:hypothetical protein
MQTSATDTLRGLETVLLLVLLVMATKAIWRTRSRLKTALEILAGMALGAVAGLAIAWPTNNFTFGGHIMTEFFYCGGIFVAVDRIRHGE